MVTNPWLASRMRLSKSSVAALQSFPENDIFYVMKLNCEIKLLLELKIYDVLVLCVGPVFPSSIGVLSDKKPLIISIMILENLFHFTASFIRSCLCGKKLQLHSGKSAKSQTLFIVK